jgi:hypothetical protein
MDDEFGAVGGILGKGNLSTWRKPAPVPLCPPQIPHDLARTRAWASAIATARLVTVLPNTPKKLRPFL